MNQRETSVEEPGAREGVTALVVERPRRTALVTMPFWQLWELGCAVLVYAACLLARVRPRPRDFPGKRSGVLAASGGAPILLVHGFSMNDGSLCWLAERVAAQTGRTVRVLRYAWLQHPDEALALITADANELAESSLGADVDVIAHSMGGALVHAARAGGARIGRIVTLGSILRPCWYARLPIGPMRHAITLERPTSGRTGDLAITSDADLFVPAAWATLDAPARSIILDRVGHAGLLIDRRVAALVANHLTPAVNPPIDVV